MFIKKPTCLKTLTPSCTEGGSPAKELTSSYKVIYVNIYLFLDNWA